MRNRWRLSSVSVEIYKALQCRYAATETLAEQVSRAVAVAVENRWVLSLDMKVESRSLREQVAVSSKSEVRQCCAIVWRVMSVEIARAVLERTTIECCMRGWATTFAGSDTAGMTFAETWTSTRPACSWCTAQQTAWAASEAASWRLDGSHARGNCRNALQLTRGHRNTGDDPEWRRLWTDQHAWLYFLRCGQKRITNLASFSKLINKKDN